MRSIELLIAGPILSSLLVSHRVEKILGVMGSAKASSVDTAQMKITVFICYGTDSRQ